MWWVKKNLCGVWGCGRFGIPWVKKVVFGITSVCLSVVYQRSIFWLYLGTFLIILVIANLVTAIKKNTNFAKSVRPILFKLPWNVKNQNSWANFQIKKYCDSGITGKDKTGPWQPSIKAGYLVNNVFRFLGTSRQLFTFWLTTAERCRFILVRFIWFRRLNEWASLWTDYLNYDCVTLLNRSSDFKRNYDSLSCLDLLPTLSWQSYVKSQKINVLRFPSV